MLPTHWKPPPSNKFKINIDGAVSGSATYRSGCSQEHPDLKKIKKKNLYLIHIRNTLNHCNTDLFIKKNPIERKPNPRPRANQTHGETVTLLAGAARSVACRPRLVVVARPPLIVACREVLVADRRSVLSCSSARPQGISPSLSLSLSDWNEKYECENV